MEKQEKARKLAEITKEAPSSNSINSLFKEPSHCFVLTLKYFTKKGINNWLQYEIIVDTIATL